jgi:hypothetical protein
MSLIHRKKPFPPTPHAPTHHAGGTDEVDAVLLKSVGLQDGQVCKLPTATEGQILRRGATEWYASPAPAVKYSLVGSNVAYPGGSLLYAMVASVSATGEYTVRSTSITLDHDAKAVIAGMAVAGGASGVDAYGDVCLRLYDGDTLLAESAVISFAGTEGITSLYVTWSGTLPAGTHTIYLKVAVTYIATGHYIQITNPNNPILSVLDVVACECVL